MYAFLFQRKADVFCKFLLCVGSFIFGAFYIDFTKMGHAYDSSASITELRLKNGDAPKVSAKPDSTSFSQIQLKNDDSPKEVSTKPGPAQVKELQLKTGDGSKVSAKSSPASVTELPLTKGHSPKVTVRPDRCTERRHIFFLRVAKTGSSTLRSLLLRFGITRNLSFVLFAKTSFTKKVYRNLLLPEPSRSTGFDGHYNLLVEHTVFNESEIKALMPDNTFYLATLRHPITQIKSFINQVRLYDKLGLNKSEHFLATFLKNPAGRDKRNDSRNVMSRYFGLPWKISDKKSGDELVKLADRKFDLVLIMELLDEGYVLLKRRLCWTTKDILYHTIRTGKYNGKDVDQTDDLIAKHRKWSSIDYAMYEHFKKKLQVGPIYGVEYSHYTRCYNRIRR